MAKQIRKQAFPFLCAVIASAFLFVLSQPSVKIYLFFLDCVWLAVCAGSIRKQNQEFLRSCVRVSLASALAFFLIKFLAGRPPWFPTPLEGLLLGIAVLLHIYALWPATSSQTSVSPREKLYPEREYDLKRIQTYLTDFPLSGINAPWGMGKSFVLERLKQNPDVLSTFEIIQIDLLTCDLDQVELILIEELDKVFRKNYIHSQNSFHLKRLLGKYPWSELLWGLLGHNFQGLSASLTGFQRELAKLDKKILLIFEDLDRICEKETIQKIFSIAEKLSCDRLHVVYQYDIHALLDLGFTRDYLEKYIPYSTSLARISYEHLVETQWGEIMPENFPLEADDVRQIRMHLSQSYKFDSLLGVKLNMRIELSDLASPRKVRNFLSELKTMLSPSSEFEKPDKRQTVLRVLFIKHFYTRCFDAFQLGASPLDTLEMAWDGSEISLPEFLVKLSSATEGKPKEDGQKERLACFKRLLNDPDNREVLAVLLLLDYELDIEETIRDLGERAAEPARNLEKKEKNERIDRTLWNIIANGTSELTDNENAIRKLQEEVLSKTGEEQDKAWDAYHRDMYHERLRSGNRTIFRFGTDTFLSLFRGMRVCGAAEAEWNAFLDFYFAQYRKEPYGQTLSRPLIDCFCYCNLRNKSTFFRMIRFFAPLSVVSNFNQEKTYQTFFQNAMQAITLHGYCERMEHWMFQLPGKVAENQKLAESLLTQLLRDLETEKGKWPPEFPQVAQEYDELILFVKKNLKLIQCETRPAPRGPSVQTKFESRWPHEKEVERLEALQKAVSAEEFVKRLQESYQEGNINLAELRALAAHVSSAPKEGRP